MSNIKSLKAHVLQKEIAERSRSISAQLAKKQHLFLSRDINQVTNLFMQSVAKGTQHYDPRDMPALAKAIEYGLDLEQKLFTVLDLELIEGTTVVELLIAVNEALEGIVVRMESLLGGEEWD